jgi:hypothetical protein
MNKHQPALHITAASVAALLFALPSAAKADVDISATAGSGPNGFRSTEVRGSADLFTTPLSVNALHFKSDYSAADAITQSAFGLKWKMSKLATLGVSHNTQDNSLINISGNAVSLAFALQTLWDGKLLTRLDLKRAASEYQFNGLPAPYDTSNQTANSLGLSQDIAEPVTLYLALDRYNYDKDPKQSISKLMRDATLQHKFFKFFGRASDLLSVPDATNTFGITWRPLEALSVDLSSSRTSTQLDQKLKTQRLGFDYQATDHLYITAAVSRVSGTAVVTKRTIFPNIPALTIPAGTTVMPATDDTYREFGLGWTF